MATETISEMVAIVQVSHVVDSDLDAAVGVKDVIILGTF